ncbi:hypothetical protein DSO57_1006520 [Entomophthora muscae]|uniref:Uncharacterized protein n=1 Tax=Entomophthora muscae TaxID=34485 RepID=A0ACC2SA45_9FUNG|nr:hypothetical protein DSO57_1006520 [Entomophthora muscae]
MHATAPGSMHSATPPPASESFVPQASSVQAPALSCLLDQLHQENSALRAQIADITKQLTLFLSHKNSCALRTASAQPTPGATSSESAPVAPSSTSSVLNPGYEMCDDAPAPPVQEASTSSSSEGEAPRATTPKKCSRSTYAEITQRANPNATPEVLKKRTSAIKDLTSQAPKLPTADRLQLVYVGGIIHKPICEVKQNLMDLGFDVCSLSIANISFLGATMCKMLMAPTAAAFFKCKVKELNCPNLRILDNFDAAKAADPKESNALKDILVNSYTKHIHSFILCDGSSSEVKKFFSSLLKRQSLPLPVVDVPANVDEIPVSSS